MPSRVYHVAPSSGQRQRRSGNRAHEVGPTGARRVSSGEVRSRPDQGDELLARALVAGEASPLHDVAQRRRTIGHSCRCRVEERVADCHTWPDGDTACVGDQCDRGTPRAFGHGRARRRTRDDRAGRVRDLRGRRRHRKERDRSDRLERRASRRVGRRRPEQCRDGRVSGDAIDLPAQLHGLGVENLTNLPGGGAKPPAGNLDGGRAERTIRREIVDADHRAHGDDDDRARRDVGERDAASA